MVGHFPCKLSLCICLLGACRFDQDRGSETNRPTFFCFDENPNGAFLCPAWKGGGQRGRRKIGLRAAKLSIDPDLCFTVDALKTNHSAIFSLRSKGFHFSGKDRPGSLSEGDRFSRRDRTPAVHVIVGNYEKRVGFHTKTGGGFPPIDSLAKTSFGNERFFWGGSDGDLKFGRLNSLRFGPKGYMT